MNNITKQIEENQRSMNNGMIFDTSKMNNIQKVIGDNPVINYYDEAIRRGYATERLSYDKCWKRLYCIKDFRQERYSHLTQWIAGEAMELPIMTEYGIEMEQEKYQNYTRELAADLFN
jgi:hypothetical protein